MGEWKRVADNVVSTFKAFVEGIKGFSLVSGE